VMRFVVLQCSGVVMYWLPIIMIVTVCGITSVLGHMVHFTDIKRYIASCSIVHMMFGILGIWYISDLVWTGVLMVTITHSFTASVLFGLSGTLYEVACSRCILMLHGYAVIIG